MTLNILQLIIRIQQLKLVPRTGWNMNFPPGHRIKTRCVPEAESVADHSYSLCMAAFAVATALGLDVEKMITMALIHDVPEIIATDIVTATLPESEKRRAKARKRALEDDAARQIFLPHGEFGAYCYALWLEYEDQATEEACILRQLDKIEAAVQAVLYAQQGHQLDPLEFIDHAEGVVTHPLLLSMLTDLREQWAESPNCP